MLSEKKLQGVHGKKIRNLSPFSGTGRFLGMLARAASPPKVDGLTSPSSAPKTPNSWCWKKNHLGNKRWEVKQRWEVTHLEKTGKIKSNRFIVSHAACNCYIKVLKWWSVIVKLCIDVNIFLCAKQLLFLCPESRYGNGCKYFETLSSSFLDILSLYMYIVCWCPYISCDKQPVFPAHSGHGNGCKYCETLSNIYL